MGYSEYDTEGEVITYASMDITYKDIVGAAIACGLHTDNDHIWLSMGWESDQTTDGEDSGDGKWQLSVA